MYKRFGVLYVRISACAFTSCICKLFCLPMLMSCLSVKSPVAGAARGSGRSGDHDVTAYIAIRNTYTCMYV